MRVAHESSASTAAINYRTQDLPAALHEHCPDRVDVFFDNVGGRSSMRCSGTWRSTGGVALCGAISSYNAEHRHPGRRTT